MVYCSMTEARPPMNGIMAPMRRAPWAALSAAVLMVFTLGLAPVGCASQRELGVEPSPDDRPLTEAQRERHIESFDLVWTTIRDRHWDPAIGGVDWDAARADLRPRVEAATTTRQARATMQELIARVGKSHFGIIPADAYETIADGQESLTTREGRTGLQVRVVGDEAVVVGVRPGSPAAQAGIVPGTVIRKVGERSFSERIERVRARIDDDDRARLLLSMGAESSLSGTVGQTLRLSVDTGGAERTLELPFVAPDGREVTLLPNLPPMHLHYETRQLPSGIGYIAFSVFADPAWLMPRFAEAVRSYREAPGIIIDLRGNPGGLGAMAMGMGGWFVDQPSQQLGTMYTREGRLNFALNPRPGNYRGPLAILIDEMSASTSEIFAGGLKDLGRARVFGVRSAGAALPSTVIRLPNGDGLQFAFANYVSVGGKELEGHGVTPDEEVQICAESLRSGVDPVLAAAERWILAHSSPQAGASSGGRPDRGTGRE
jgi:carboxyl-terminal processing protease